MKKIGFEQWIFATDGTWALVEGSNIAKQTQFWRDFIH